MSMDRCAECGNPVDTDDYPEAYVGPLNHEKCVCEHCQDMPESQPSRQDWYHNARFKA
jgi:recombinational DNA repair protein (RecF pathway)